MASKKHLFICTGLILIVLALYWQVNDHEFINYDDNIYVTENYHTQGGFTLQNVIWAFKTLHFNIYHPLTWLSHMLDYQLFGLNSGMHHLINVFFHVANTLLLFLVFRRMTQDLWQSAFVAALFAVHPLHVESVAWVAERKDVLSTFFWFLTMWMYVRYVENPNLIRYLIVLLCFILGLLSKPMVVTLPFVLLLMDYWPLKRFQFNRAIIQRLVMEKIPMLVFSAASCILTYLAKLMYLAQEIQNVIQLPLDFRIANALISYIIYLYKMICPVNLAVFYPHFPNFPWWQLVGALLLLLLISLFFIRFSKTHPYFIIGWLWYLGTLVPVIGLIQNGSHARADRYAYIPLIGIFIIIAWALPDLLKRWRYKKIGLIVMGVIVLTVFSMITLSYTKFWRNSITLFEHAVAVTPSNLISHNSLGLALQEKNRFDEAVKHFKEVLRLKPDYAVAYNNMGIILTKQNKTNEAIDHFKEALRLQSDYYDAHNNIGIVLDKQGRLDEAIGHFKEALRLQPDFFNAYNNLGIALDKQGRIDEAIKHYRSALQMKPDYIAAYNYLGIDLGKKGRLDEAIGNFKKVLRLQPDNLDAHYNLGIALDKQGRRDEAIEYFKNALRIRPDYAEAHINLGIALAQKGNTEEAIDHFQRALQIRPDYIIAKKNLDKFLMIQKRKQ